LDINPLIVMMSVRSLQPCKYWFSQYQRFDQLLIQGFPHHEAHEISQRFFHGRKEYTHLWIWCEDIIATPSQADLLAEGVEKHGFQVLSGYTNYHFGRYWSNVTVKDVSKLNPVLADQYGFIDIRELACKDLNNPYMRVNFVGLPFTIIERSVVEEVGFKPFKYVTDRVLGGLQRRGIMFDLRFCQECAKRGIPIYIDLRLALLHYGDTRHLIAKQRPPKAIKFRKAGERDFKEIKVDVKQLEGA